MIAARVGRIDAAPAEQLRPPGDIGVLAVHKEIWIEKLTVDRDVVDHAPAVQRSRGGCSEHVFMLQIMTVVDLLAAPVQMPEHGREINSGGIDEWFIGEIEGGED